MDPNGLAGLLVVAGTDERADDTLPLQEVHSPPRW